MDFDGRVCWNNITRGTLLLTPDRGLSGNLDQVGKNVIYSNTRVDVQPTRLPRRKEVGCLVDGNQGTNSSCCGNGIRWRLTERQGVSQSVINTSVTGLAETFKHYDFSTRHTA